MPHDPGHLRDAFLLWIEAGRPEAATVEDNYYEPPQQRPACAP
jgi:hypothetical protein